MMGSYIVQTMSMDRLINDVIVYISRFLLFGSFKSLKTTCKRFYNIIDDEYETRILQLPQSTDYLIINDLRRFIGRRTLPERPSIESLNKAMKRGNVNSVRIFWVNYKNMENSYIVASEILQAISQFNEDNNDDYYELFDFASRSIERQRHVLFWKCVKRAIKNGNKTMVINIHRQYLERKKRGMVSAIKEAIKCKQKEIVEYFMEEGWEFIETSTETFGLLRLALSESEIFKLLHSNSTTIDIYRDDSLLLAKEAKTKGFDKIIRYLIYDQKLTHINTYF